MHGSDVRGTARRTFAPGLLDRSAKLLDRIVFSCLLGLIVLSVIPYGMADVWWEAVFECAVFAITGIWIFEVLFRGSWEIKRLVVLLPLVLMTAYAFAQAIEWPWAWLATEKGQIVARHTLTIDPYQTRLTAIKMLALTVFLGLLLIHTSTPKRLRWLVGVVIGLALASALFGVLRQFSQSPDSTTGFFLPFLFSGVGYGQFISANVFAYLMEMPFGVLAGLILGGGVVRSRVSIYLAIALIVWAALVLSNSRGGMLGLGCQSIFLLFMSLSWYARRRSQGVGRQPGWLAFVQGSVLIRALAIMLIAGTLLVGVFWMGGERLAIKLNAQDSLDQTIDGSTRTEIWRSTWKLIKEHPATGVGFGAYFLAIPEYQTGSGRIKVEQAHNDYLDLAANGGVIALCLAGCWIAMIIWRARFSLLSADTYRRAACLGALGGMLSVAVHSFVDFGLQVASIEVVLGALVVISVADRRVETSATGLEAR